MHKVDLSGSLPIEGRLMHSLSEGHVLLQVLEKLQVAYYKA